MSGPPDQVTEAQRWLSEAFDEFTWARVRKDPQELAPGTPASFVSLPWRRH